MEIKNLIFVLVMTLTFSSLSYAYTVEPQREVHQHVTNESQFVWKVIPKEIKDHLNKPIDSTLNDNFDESDEIVIGSGEEDKLFRWRFHFWDHDQTDNSNYDVGLGGYFSSSYRRALELWNEEVIPNYLKGDINRSYYFLGRVAHLLEDVAQPSHVLLDCHPGTELSIIGTIACDQSKGDNGTDDSVLEEYTGNNFQSLKNTYNWSGNNFVGKQYEYNNLPNMDAFNWKEIGPTRIPDKQFIELFKLFWYTAQKSQYWASDDNDGNSVYSNLSGNQKSFSTSLWQNEGVSIIDRNVDLVIEDQTDSGKNISLITNATISHAMKATAGLYRLFWDTVHSFDWPTYHHDNQRTGFTILKGDIDSTNTKNDINFVLQDSSNTDLIIASVANLEGDGGVRDV